MLWRMTIVISRFSSHAPYECESTVDVQYVDSRVDKIHHAMLCDVNAEMPFSDKQPRSAGVPYIISCSVGIRVAPLTWRGGKCIRLHRIHLLSFIFIPSTARSDPSIPTLAPWAYFQTTLLSRNCILSIHLLGFIPISRLNNRRC